MKLSRCRRYTKHYKYMRHTKHGGGGKKYKTKRTYHKHSRKLKHKSRLQKGGMWRSRKVAPELFEFPTPAPYNELINYQDMTVSTNSRGNDTYSFVNTSDQSPIFYSSTGKRNMVLSFIKVQPGRTKSLTKHFNWLIALKQIEDITRPEGLGSRYKYTYSIMLSRLSKRRQTITLNTDVYLILFPGSLSNSLKLKDIFIENDDQPSGTVSSDKVLKPTLAQGLTLKVYTNGKITEGETYTFSPDVNDYDMIKTNILLLRRIGDIIVLKNLYNSLNDAKDRNSSKDVIERIATAIRKFNKVAFIDPVTRILSGIPPIYDDVNVIIDESRAALTGAAAVAAASSPRSAASSPRSAASSPRSSTKSKLKIKEIESPSLPGNVSP